MTTKQNNLIDYAKSLGVTINNIENYQNKESILQCICPNGHQMEHSVEYLLKTGFECMDCITDFQQNIIDTTPYFLSLDAATYITGMSIFNKEGQLLGHKTFTVDKKIGYFNRLKIIVGEIKSIIQKQKIKCVILEDCQYQNNAALYKKLCMLQGAIRFLIINELGIENIMAYPDEWRSYNHIGGTKRAEQKLAAIEKVKEIFHQDIPEDESESILLGLYGINQYYLNQNE